MNNDKLRLENCKKKTGANYKVKWQLFSTAVLESKYPQLVP